MSGIMLTADLNYAQGFFVRQIEHFSKLTCVEHISLKRNSSEFVMSTSKCPVWHAPLCGRMTATPSVV